MPRQPITHAERIAHVATKEASQNTDVPTVEMNGAVISTPITNAIAYWRQVIKDRNPDADAHNLLRNAAIDLRRILDIDRTVHPESNVEAKQTAVDALNEMATDAKIEPDDAQEIFADAFKKPPASDEVRTENLDGNAGDQKSSAHEWGDPDWSIFDDRRGTLPEFPVDVFSPAWQEWLVRAAHGAGVRVEHVAVPLLGVASSLIGTARRIRASRSWSEPMTLWACVVADSGDRKTPGLNVTMRALTKSRRTIQPPPVRSGLTMKRECKRQRKLRRNGKKSAKLRSTPSRRKSRRRCRLTQLIPATSSSRAFTRLIRPSSDWRRCCKQGREA